MTFHRGPPGDRPLITWDGLPERTIQTFRLLKLHGSLNWYWTPGDAAGVSLARRELPGTYMACKPYEEEDRAQRLPGRVPFLVPPTATKSTYYSVPLIHEIWRQAADRLLAASRVFLLGYSLPLTDLTTTALLRATLVRDGVDVFVADLASDGVIESLHALGVPSENIHPVPHGAEGPIPEAVHSWAEHTSTRVLEDVQRATGPGETVVVSWGNGAYALGIGAHDRGETLEVEVADPVASLAGATNAGSQDPLPQPLTVEDLIKLGGNTPRPLAVTMPEGGRQLIVGHSRVVRGIGLGYGLWRVLSATGPTPATPGASGVVGSG